MINESAIYIITILSSMYNDDYSSLLLANQKIIILSVSNYWFRKSYSYTIVVGVSHPSVKCLNSMNFSENVFS